MSAPTSTTSQRTSPLSLALAAIFSALLVVGAYEMRARLSKGHPAPPPAALQSERPDHTAVEGLVARTRPGESCDSLRNRYVLLCSTDKALPGARTDASTASMSPEHEAAEMASTLAWAHPTKPELADMARRCEIRFVSPALTESQAPTVDDEHARALSLSSNERAELDQTLRQMHQSLADFVRQAYADGATDPALASSLSLEQMINDIQARPNSGYGQAWQSLAQERAGMATPPAAGADLPPGERILRLTAGLGDEFEKRLTDRLGADRAHQLLYSPLADAWTTRVSQSGCPQVQ